MAVCGSCSRAPCSCVPIQGLPGCNPGGRGPGVFQPPANTPPPVSYLACSPAMAQQFGVDIARQINHTLGYRPYKVRLVWQVRDELSGQWSEASPGGSLELMPVEVRDFDTIELLVEAPGQKPAGVINLREVSPAQVDEATIRGYRDGEPWGDDTADREFFYEVQLIGLCPGDRHPRTWRFVLAGAPTLRMDNSEWRIKLTTQLGYRDEQRQDQTVVDGDEVFESATLLA